MVWMIITIVGGVGFANLMRLAQVRERNMWWVGATNYLLAAGLWLAWWAISSRCPMLTREAFLGVCGGVGYAMAYALMNAGIRCAGIGIASAVSRLSLVVPVAVSVVFWHETLSTPRAVGLLLVLIALSMLYRGKAVPTQVSPRKKMLVLLGLFLVIGVSRLCMKAMAMGTPEGGKLVFLIFMLGTAGVIVLGYALWKAQRPTRGEIVHGLGLGVVNGVALFAMVSALVVLDAVVVFPTVSIGVILVGALTGHWLWGERFPRMVLVGMAAGAVALVLVNL